MVKKRRNTPPKPEYLVDNYKKVVDVLLKTKDNNLPISFTVLLKASKLHHQIVLDIVSDLRHWGLMDKNDYLITDKHFKKLEPLLKETIEYEEGFKERWSKYFLIVFIIAIGSLYIFAPIKYTKITIGIILGIGLISLLISQSGKGSHIMVIFVVAFIVVISSIMLIGFDVGYMLSKIPINHTVEDVNMDYTIDCKYIKKNYFDIPAYYNITYFDKEGNKLKNEKVFCKFS